jgi:hypothetical protein
MEDVMTFDEYFKKSHHTLMCGGEVKDAWQAGAASRDAEVTTLREQVTLLRSYLEAIVDPIKYMRAKLEDGQCINGQMAIQLSESHSYLKGLANEALASDNEYLYVAAIERDQLKERLDLLMESSEMLAAELDELRLDSKRYGYLTRECRARDFIIPASERKQSIDSAIDKALASTEHHDRS